MSIMIASTLAVLDTFTSIGHTTRMGIGYGIGFGISGFPKMWKIEIYVVIINIKRNKRY